MKIYFEDGTSWTEPHFQMKFLKPDNWLVEEYCKIDVKVAEELIDLLIAFIQRTIEPANFFKKCISRRIVFGEAPEGTDTSYLKFDPSLGVTIVPITVSQAEALIDEPGYRRKYAKLLKTMIVHEDTHKQQFDRYEGYNKDYKLPGELNLAKGLSQKNIAYFSQTIEADAYGRQFGEALLQKYPNKTAYWIFEKLVEGKISTSMDEIVETYRNDKVSKKAFKHFWRSCYDYLVTEKSIKREPYGNLNEVYEILAKKKIRKHS